MNRTTTPKKSQAPKKSPTSSSSSASTADPSSGYVPGSIAFPPMQRERWITPAEVRACFRPAQRPWPSKAARARALELCALAYDHAEKMPVVVTRVRGLVQAVVPHGPAVVCSAAEWDAAGNRAGKTPEVTVPVDAPRDAQARMLAELLENGAPSQEDAAGVAGRLLGEVRLHASDSSDLERFFSDPCLVEESDGTLVLIENVMGADGLPAVRIRHVGRVVAGVPMPVQVTNIDTPVEELTVPTFDDADQLLEVDADGILRAAE